MKKRTTPIRLNENQLYELVEQVLAEMEKTPTDSYVYYNQNPIIVGDDPSELDNIFGNDEYYEMDMGDKLKEKVKPGDSVLHVGYYGECGSFSNRKNEYGTLSDRAVIEYFSKKYPNNIVAFYGSNNKLIFDDAYIFGNKDFLTQAILEALGDTYYQLFDEICREKVDYIVDCYTPGFDDKRKEDLYKWIKTYYDDKCGPWDIKIPMGKKFLEFLYKNHYITKLRYHIDMEQLFGESIIRNITENVIRKLNEGIYDELKEDYGTRNLALLIDNDEECQKQVQWVVQALVKKVRRGLVPELDYLADCSTVRKILQMGMRKLKAQAREYETPMPYLDNGQKRQVRLYIAQCILDDVEYDSKIS